MMLWVPSICVHRQYGTIAKLNRKNYKQENQKHDRDNWELNKITQEKVDLVKDRALGTSGIRRVRIQQDECIWEWFKGKEGAETDNVTKNQRSEYFKNQWEERPAQQRPSHRVEQ